MLLDRCTVVDRLEDQKPQGKMTVIENRRLKDDSPDERNEKKHDWNEQRDRFLFKYHRKSENQDNGPTREPIARVMLARHSQKDQQRKQHSETCDCA